MPQKRKMLGLFKIMGELVNGYEQLMVGPVYLFLALQEQNLIPPIIN